MTSARFTKNVTYFFRKNPMPKAAKNTKASETREPKTRGRKATKQAPEVVEQARTSWKEQLQFAPSCAAPGRESDGNMLRVGDPPVPTNWYLVAPARPRSNNRDAKNNYSVKDLKSGDKVLYQKPNGPIMYSSVFAGAKHDKDHWIFLIYDDRYETNDSVGYSYLLVKTPSIIDIMNDPGEAEEVVEARRTHAKNVLIRFWRHVEQGEPILDPENNQRPQENPGNEQAPALLQRRKITIREKPMTIQQVTAKVLADLEEGQRRHGELQQQVAYLEAEVARVEELEAQIVQLRAEIHRLQLERATAEEAVRNSRAQVNSLMEMAAMFSKSSRRASE